MKIKDTPKIKKEITRQCAICGKNILVKVFVNEKYIGGNYFCDIPTVGEYWECDKCYNNWK
ncbi:MAG: hypothetical protein NTZ65_01445 [Candidatus Berkelbacteria bacterium]|nr:hypothetical protein [Candidatus Berkelbacteria bacterium]